MRLTATTLVISCENSLGWSPDPTKELWQARSIEAAKITRKLKQTNGVTLEDLALALEYCYRRREPIVSPLNLFTRVEEAKALALAASSTKTDISASVQAAVDWELGRPEPDSSWLGRLIRSHGDGRQVVLDAWRAAGRG